MKVSEGLAVLITIVIVTVALVAFRYRVDEQRAECLKVCAPYDVTLFGFLGDSCTCDTGNLRRSK